MATRSEPPVEGLQELERRILLRLKVGERGEVILRWEVDGRVFIRLQAHRTARGVRYIWLEETVPGQIRREIGGLEELERLIKRQLLEPGGERLIFLWDGHPEAIFRAMIVAGDRLRCVWEPIE
ncbi:MAG: hypothetical protein KatS3mg115_1688 [Candidatus Poribacteria bacterium]|nr:MAG: hypothetical protein KatS3mg115_1688 [Candidatus Poribacteria bacterium]